MNNLQNHIENYLDYCRTQKCLDKKTLKAYRIDLRQFSEQISVTEASDLTSATLETYVAKLHQQYAPKTVKRKIASLKALFHYFEYKEIIDHNPFYKLQIKFREPIILPKTIPCNGVQREHNKKLNNGLPILHKVPPKRDYGRYFCIMAEKGGTSHGGLTEKLSPFFHAKKQEVNAYGR